MSDDRPMTPEEMREELSKRVREVAPNQASEQTFVGIESTFATTLPTLKPLWIRDGVSIVGERVEIDTSALPAPRQDPSVVGLVRVTDTAVPESTNEWWLRWVKGRITSAITVASLLRYPADSDDYLRHTEDYLRTRIKPGADPRQSWDEGEAPSDSRMFLGHDDAGYSAKRRAQVRKFPRGRRRAASRRGTARWSMFEMTSDDEGPTWSVIEYGARLPGCNYVPCDVCRWRDPAHRDELTRRAREYAECVQMLVGR